MSDNQAQKCLVCGGETWTTTISAPDFRIEECTHGCIGRTVPAPPYVPTPIPRPDDSLDEKYAITDDRCGLFNLAREILDSTKRYQPSGRLLDIGCGLGHLMKLARERGYEVEGIDSSPGAVGFAADVFGLSPVVGFFPDPRYSPESFDVVTLNHVIEHVDDPVGVLSAIKDILKPGGILAVAAPNYDSLVRRMRKGLWSGLQPTQHIWQLPINAIAEFTRMAGLEPVVIRRTSLQYPRGSRSLPNWAMLKTVLTAASVLKMGDNSVVLARKR